MAAPALPAAGLALAAALLALWLMADPRTPDLAAAAYRVGLFRQLGFAVWDEHWYAGHHLPGYSLLFPPLASLFGLRVICVLAVLASVTLFDRLTRSVYGPAARWGVAWFAVAAVGDVWIGRLAFALGTAFALAAVLTLARGRALLAGLLAAVCAAASPVAGVLLALAAFTYAVWRRSPRAALALAAPACAIVAAATLLFPEGGTEPYPLFSFMATLLVVGAFMWALPPAQPLLRVGALVYAIACVLCLAVPTPIGSNIERYAVLLAGPLLVCALMSEGVGEERSAASRARRQRAISGTGGRARPVAAVALCVIAVWVAWGPVRETLAVAGNESTRASYYVPLERFLARSRGAPGRVEVPLTRSHWETALLAPKVSLARGWEKQLDSRFDGPLLSTGLTASAYQQWLQAEAVSYVALPDTPLDPSSAREGRLIRHGLPYLREVFASKHWRVYAVVSATPLLSGPGRLSSLGHDSFTLLADSSGRFLVRVHFTPYWALVQGAGCVHRGPGGWTSVSVAAPGAVTVAARFSLGRALGLASACHLPGGR